MKVKVSHLLFGAMLICLGCAIYAGGAGNSDDSVIFGGLVVFFLFVGGVIERYF